MDRGQPSWQRKPNLSSTLSRSQRVHDVPAPGSSTPLTRPCRSPSAPATAGSGRQTRSAPGERVLVVNCSGKDAGQIVSGVAITFSGIIYVPIDVFAHARYM